MRAQVPPRPVVSVVDDHVPLSSPARDRRGASPSRRPPRPAPPCATCRSPRATAPCCAPTCGCPTATRRKVPTVLTATGYNKDATNPLGTSCGARRRHRDAPTRRWPTRATPSMLVDDRGTGASQGKWDSWGERTQRRLPGACWTGSRRSRGRTGRSATTGGSYMGITSLPRRRGRRARVKAGKPRAVKAVWADVPMCGRLPRRHVPRRRGRRRASSRCGSASRSGLSTSRRRRRVTDPGGSLPTYAEHLRQHLRLRRPEAATDATTGGDERLRRPVLPPALARHAAPRRSAIPVAWAGGWWDIFQRGEPLLYEQLANAPATKFFMTPQLPRRAGPGAWAAGIGTERSLTRTLVRPLAEGDRERRREARRTSTSTRWAPTPGSTYPQWPVPGTRYTTAATSATPRALSFDKPAAAGRRHGRRCCPPRARARA